MSVQASTDSLLASLKSISSQYSAQASALATEAQDALQSALEYSPQFPMFSDPGRSNPGLERAPQPPELDVVEYQYPADPPLLALPRVAVSGRPERPGDEAYPGRAWDATVLRESYSYEPLPPPPTGPSSVPDFNLGVEPTAPRMTVPKSFSFEPSSGTPPGSPEAPSFPTFDEDFFTRYHEILNPLGTTFGQFRDWLGTVLTRVVASDHAVFDEVRQVLAETAWSVPEGDWYAAADRLSSNAAQQERHAALREWGAAPGMTTGLPFGAKIEVATDILLGDLRQRYEALQKLDDTLSEQEWELLTQAMRTAEVWVRLALSMTAKQLEWMQQIESVTQAGAQGAVGVVLQVIAMREREVEIRTRYYDLQIRRHEALLARETTKLDATRIALESESLKLAHNRTLLQAHRVALGLVDQRVRNYQLAIDYARTLQQLERVDLDRLNAEVREFQANVELFTLRQRRDAAKAQEERLFMDAEISRREAYLVELRGHVAKRAIEQANIRQDAQEMRQTAQLYNSKVGGLITEFEAISRANDVAVTAIAAGVEAEGAEVEIRVMDQEIEDLRAIREQISVIEDEKLRQTYELRQQQLIVARAKAIGESKAQSAGVAAGIASQAYSGLNGLATTVVREFS